MQRGPFDARQAAGRQTLADFVALTGFVVGQRELQRDLNRAEKGSSHLK